MESLIFAVAAGQVAGVVASDSASGVYVVDSGYQICQVRHSELAVWVGIAAAPDRSDSAAAVAAALQLGKQPVDFPLLQIA